MGPSLLLAVYLAPAGLVLLNMIRARSFSLYNFSGLRRLPKRITLEEWLAVFGHLGISLESWNQPPGAKPKRPWRLIGSRVAFAASLVFFQFILPLNIPLSFAQHGWNVFPAIQAAIAGGLLASAIMLAFHRPRRWHLIGLPMVEYPYLEWKALKRETTKDNGK